MKSKLRYILPAVFVVIISVTVCAFSLSEIKSRTISFIPDDVTTFLYSYLDLCMTRPEEAVDYVHFENEIEAEAFDRSQKKVLDYEILGAQIINENLYVFTLDLKKIHNTYPKRYYFVGRINNELRLMVNAGNVPEELRIGFNENDFTLTSEDLNGALPVSPDAIIQ